LAGSEGSQFFGITSELGPGFFILIVYSMFAGFFQYLFNCAVSGHYQIDVHDKINYVWTTVFKRFLRNTENATVTHNQMAANQKGTESILCFEGA